MGNLMGKMREIPTAGQAGFPPFPPFPEGESGKGERSPGNSRLEQGAMGNSHQQTGNGKREIGEVGNAPSAVAFTIPGQPQGKGRPRVGSVAGRARMFTPAKTVAYEGLVAHVVQEAMAGRPLLEGPVEMVLELNCQVPASWSKKKQAQALAGEIRPTTKPDADNVLKAICDGCNGVLWRDDVQVVEVALRKRYALVPSVAVQARAL